MKPSSAGVGASTALLSNKLYLNARLFTCIPHLGRRDI